MHPYAKAAYRIITIAFKVSLYLSIIVIRPGSATHPEPQVVLAQVQRDINIIHLAECMDDLYAFMEEAEPLRKIESHRKVMVRIAQQTTECGYFISAYYSDNFRKFNP